MIEKSYKNDDLGIELKSFIDKQQIIWFRGKEVAEILGYSNTKKAVLTHVDIEDKKQLFTYHTSGPKVGPVGSNTSGPKMGPVAPSGSICTYINESGFYSLVLS